MTFDLTLKLKNKKKSKLRNEVRYNCYFEERHNYIINMLACDIKLQNYYRHYKLSIIIILIITLMLTVWNKIYKL